jgi:hypothetical protein
MCKFMAHHRVQQLPLAPGTGFLELARLATVTQSGTDILISEAKFTEMLFLDDPGASPKVRVSSEDSKIKIESINSTSAFWSVHAEMTVAEVPNGHTQEWCTEEEDSVQEWSSISGDEFYSMTGNDYRGEFRSVETIWLQETSSKTMISRINIDAEPSGIYSVSLNACIIWL